jgi:hypothetical protein
VERKEMKRVFPEGIGRKKNENRILKGDSV